MFEVTRQTLEHHQNILCHSCLTDSSGHYHQEHSRRSIGKEELAINIHQDTDEPPAADIVECIIRL